MPEDFATHHPKKPHAGEIHPSPRPYLASFNEVKLFTAYCPHPKGVTFTSQEHDETIQLLLRRHMATNIPWLIKTSLLLVVPLAFFVFTLFFPLITFPVPTGVIISLTAFYYLIVFSYGFSSFISWFYNIGLITNTRVIDMDSYNILHHNIAATHLPDVVDVEFTQKGFLASTFNFGDIHIHTEAVKAGLQSNFEFNATPNPAKVTDTIIDLREKMKGGKHHDV